MSHVLRPGHKDFSFAEGIVLCQRAAFEISNNCPAEYRSIFITAINAGWIKPVAYVSDEEYMVMKLTH